MRIRNYYDTVAEATRRLNGTVCRYKGEFYQFHVSHLGITMTDLRTGGIVHKNISFDDPDIDISIPKLGYVNTTGAFNKITDVVYTVRLPLRGQGYVQGLCSRNVFGKSICGEFTYWHLDESWGSFITMLEGKYPKLDECITFKTFALSKDIAFKKAGGDVLTFLRCDYIGNADLGNKVVTCTNQLVRELATPFLQEVGFETEKADEYREAA